MYTRTQMKHDFPSRGFAAARLLAPLSLLLLAACGGGGGGSAGSGALNLSTPSIPPTASSLAASTLYTGSVSGLGSIVVNGVRFETVGAKVPDVDDSYGSSAYTDPVRLGMTVVVEGATDDSKGTGTASKISIDGGMRGQIGTVDAPDGTFSVNGQTVKVNANTLIQGAASLAGIAAASWVEVYGLAQSNGSYLATRVEVYGAKTALESNYPKAAEYPISLRGIVETATSSGFTLPDGRNGRLSVSYSAANVQPAGANIAAGGSVRVLAKAAPDANGAVLAAKVLVLTPSTLLGSVSASTPVKLKGVVDSVNGNTLVVSGTTVDISAALKPASAIARNQVVEVKGTLSNGTLVASKLEFESKETSYTARQGETSASVGYQQELYGLISGHDAVRGTFVVQGVTVQANSATKFEYGYSKLGNNTYVEVKGALQNGVLLATKIEVKGATASGSGGDISGDAGSGPGNDEAGKSSGGSSFELYGTLACGNFPSTCTIDSGVNVLTANLTTALWEKGAYVANSYVEAKGLLDKAGVFQVAKIEVKR